MRDYYIPDLTERYPEGFDGVDMFAPRDLEAAAWADMEREYRESERQEIERITREGYEVIEQGSDGWTLAESGGVVFLGTIKNGQIEWLYDTAKNTPENRDSLYRLWQDMNE